MVLVCLLFVLSFAFAQTMAAAPSHLQAQGEAKDKSDASLTPLMRAIDKRDERAFKSLLDQADLNARDDRGWTALMLAARSGAEDFVKALLKKGADVNAQSNDGLSALILAARMANPKDSVSVDTAKMLIERGADVNARAKDGQTALMGAARRGRLKLVKLLLEKGAKINDEDNDHATALTYAVGGKDQATIAYLKSAGATGPAPTPAQDAAMAKGVDQRPVPLNNPTPQYTEEARKNGVEGVIIARVLVGADGNVQQVRIVRGLPDGLDEMAIRAAYRLKFKPAMKDGKPAAFWQAVSIEFHLRRGPGASL
jgi:TonB family protein